MFYIVIIVCIGQSLAQSTDEGCSGPHTQSVGACPGSACEPTCVNPLQACVIPLYVVCSCEPDYVRTSVDNTTCVAVNSLSCRQQRGGRRVTLPENSCSTNEQFNACGLCSATCAQPTRCGYCGCLQGFLRDNNGRCIRTNSRRCLSLTSATNNSSNSSTSSDVVANRLIG